nr:dihydroorotase family protein [Candidatus Njordarchaeum guaymaensis]
MKKAELRITNSKILVGDNLVEAGVAISEGRIVKVAKEPHLPPADKTINSQSMLMIPGVVDAHVHLRDMNLSYKEDFSSGTEAAVSGGVTTVLDMPNTSPPTANAERLKEKMCKATNMVYSNVGFFGALPMDPSETCKMIDEGVIGFKLYLNDPQYELQYDKTLPANLLKPVLFSGFPLAVHAEFPQKQEEEMGSTSTKSEIGSFLRAHDPRMETGAVSMCVRTARKLGVQIHVCHLSTESGLSIIRREKVAGTPVTAETTPHHLLLSEKQLHDFGSYAKMVPPLRTLRDASSLMKGLRTGTVDIIASDHAPHTNEEKEGGFTVAPSGIPGLETMLSLILTEMSEGRITLRRLVETMSQNPSKIFGLKRIGKIAEGYDADIVVVDLRKEKIIRARDFHSKAKYTPFEGRKVKGVPVMTIVNGLPVMQDGEIIENPGVGKIAKHITST